MAYLGIYWMDDAGQEWGQTCMMSLVDGELPVTDEKHGNESLWLGYERWVDEQ